MTSHDLNLLHRYQDLLNYELALQEANDDLIRFAELSMPKRGQPDDVSQSEYIVADHHRYIADRLMDVEAGAIQKLILNTPPRHGKTQLATIFFAAWYSGLHPTEDIIVATYGGEFAEDFGRQVRDIVRSPRFKQIFPEYGDLAYGGQSSDHLINRHGGNLYFLGRRSPTTGRGANLILIDDPIKDDKEARLQTFRDDLWEWFTKTLLTRRHNDQAKIAITLTRWSEDDIVGRLTDPTNPAYSERFSKGFQSINLPAIAGPEDELGRKDGEALWPKRFNIGFLEEMRAVDPVGFSSLYQCDPTPDDGVFFQADEIFEYEQHELPKNLMIYGASDHAVSTKQSADLSCIGLFGVDENKTAWVLPDLVWRRIDTREAVEQMIRLIKEYDPLFWYGEKGQISRSIEPYLKARMAEEEVHVALVQDHPAVDKVQRAQPSRARMAQGRIKFPKFAPWWPRAKKELLKFPNARFDDFVDFVAIIGMKLQTHRRAHRMPNKTTFEEGTFGFLKQQWARQDAAEKARRNGGHY